MELIVVIAQIECFRIQIYISGVNMVYYTNRPWAVTLSKYCHVIYC